MCPAPPVDIDVWEMDGLDAMNDGVPRPSGVSSAAEERACLRHRDWNALQRSYGFHGHLRLGAVH